MTNHQALFQLTEKCDIFFEGSLISKELIIQKYADFFTTSISTKERSLSIALHTGSVCFDVVSFIMATLTCISMDQTDSDEIIASLVVGDIVLLKNERYRWRGIETKSGISCMCLEQDGRGKNGPTILWLPLEKNKGSIKPYNGASEVTDGRGIKKTKSNRADFISYITGKDESDIPSITGASAVIVADRTLFDRIQKGLKIIYNGKSISLLDIVPASYYTDGDEPYQFGSNPSKAEPVLKITGKVSIARDLVLDKHGNRTVGFVVIDPEAASKGYSELEDLLGRKSLKFSHISMSIDSENIEAYIGNEDSSVFACTKEFLLQHSKPMVVSNPLTTELDRQVENIVNNEVTMEVINDGCTWDTYRKIKNALFLARQSDWNEDRKKSFVVPAYSLLNLFTTAVFSMKSLESAIANEELQLGVSSPYGKISELWNIAKSSGSLESQCVFVANALDDLYKSILWDSLKDQALCELVKNSFDKKLAIIIPKAYYADILKKESLFSEDNIVIMTANRFDASQMYDKIIVVGDFSGKRFDALRCNSAADIVVLLYECETRWFKRRKSKAYKFEKKLNSICGLNEDFDENDGYDLQDKDMAVEQFEDESMNLEEYINTISVFDIHKFVTGVSASGSNTPLSEVTAIGKFVSGEQIVFSKYYKAVIYNSSKVEEPITETDVDKLVAGDTLLFTKRDDFTRNIVDNVFEALQTSGKLSSDVLDATKKALWWKKVLREYQVARNLSYRQLAKNLGEFGCAIQEQGIRQWLVPDSHIVGPREESTLLQIAEMTQDPYLLGDVSSFFNACRTVRRQRKKILELIGKAIEDKLSGHQPPQGSELEIVYNNIENLSEILELETVTFLSESISVPINIINKPIADMEVTS